MESALRYAWVKRLITYLQVGDQDVCSIMSMNDEELEEYRVVMKNLFAFQSQQGKSTQTAL